MKGVFYMWRHSIKNYFIQAVKKPLGLIMYLLFVALIVFSLAISNTHGAALAQRKIEGYAAILVGVFLFVAVLSILNGLKQGTALFSMADVNFLFTAPVDASKLLMGGIAKQASIMLMASLFMIAQYPNMRNLAGLDGMALVGLMVAYACAGIVLNILSATLYTFCAGSLTRRKRVYQCIMALFAVILLFFTVMMMRSGNIQQSLVAVFGSNIWNVVPVIGWARGLAVAFAEYRFFNAAVYFALMMLGGYLCIRLLRGSDMDFFEDVLLAAENANQKREDAQAGRMPMQGEVSGRVKRDIGDFHSKGALIFAERMMREQQRGGFWLLDISTLSAAAVPLVCMALLSSDMTQSVGLWPLFAMATWILLFVNLRGNMLRELTYPALYLAPYSAFSKLLAILFPQLIKALVDGVVFALFVLLLLKVSAIQAVIAFLYYVSMMMVFSAGNLLVERILGGMRNRMLIMLLYTMMLLVLCLPGMIAAMILGPGLAENMPYLLYVGWNGLVTLLVVFLCRNILTSMELT